MNDAIKTVESAIEKGISIKPQIGGFPYLAQVFHESGIQKNTWFLPSCQSFYYTTKGTVIIPSTSLIDDTTNVPDFNQDVLINALRADQTGQTSFPEFLNKIWQAGVVRYCVDLIKRTVTYYGCHDESYTENYLAVQLP